MSDSLFLELKNSLLQKYELNDALNEERIVKNGWIDLLSEELCFDKFNKEMYDTSLSVDIYRNFLNWLFATFKVDEFDFRKSCIEQLGDIKGKNVLITSCGLGEDVKVAGDCVGENGFVHAQDLSRYFVTLVAEKYLAPNVVLTVSNALDLPYRDNYFDAVYHFGGINLFGDISLAIFEMNRVCKVGGTVLFGDESVALHLREDDFGKMFIENNILWKEKVPLEHLPLYATDINLRYVLGNCFYLIKFKKGSSLPTVDIDVEHIGYRGGSVRKRYFGKIEGIDVKLKNKLYEKAKQQGTSVSRIIENLLKDLKF